MCNFFSLISASLLHSSIFSKVKLLRVAPGDLFPYCSDSCRLGSSFDINDSADDRLLSGDAEALRTRPFIATEEFLLVTTFEVAI